MTSNDSPQIQALFAFVQKTPMLYGYKMLLLLVMLQVGKGGGFSLEETVGVFDRFYRRREELGLLPEKQRGTKQAQLARKDLPSTIKNGPAPRFQGFLSLSADKTHFEIQEDVWKAITPEDSAALCNLAIQRLATHFGDEKQLIEALVQYAFEDATDEKQGTSTTQ
jgi:hypothetical protein